jgi:hypothetical protein
MKWNRLKAAWVVLADKNNQAFSRQRAIPIGPYRNLSGPPLRGGF